LISDGLNSAQDFLALPNSVFAFEKTIREILLSANTNLTNNRVTVDVTSVTFASQNGTDAPVPAAALDDTLAKVLNPYSRKLQTANSLILDFTITIVFINNQLQNINNPFFLSNSLEIVNVSRSGLISEVVSGAWEPIWLENIFDLNIDTPELVSLRTIQFSVGNVVVNVISRRPTASPTNSAEAAANNNSETIGVRFLPVWIAIGAVFILALAVAYYLYYYKKFIFAEPVETKAVDDIDDFGLVGDDIYVSRGANASVYNKSNRQFMSWLRLRSNNESDGLGMGDIYDPNTNDFNPFQRSRRAFHDSPLRSPVSNDGSSPLYTPRSAQSDSQSPQSPKNAGRAGSAIGDIYNETFGIYTRSKLYDPRRRSSYLAAAAVSGDNPRTTIPILPVEDPKLSLASVYDSLKGYLEEWDDENNDSFGDEFVSKRKSVFDPDSNVRAVVLQIIRRLSVSTNPNETEEDPENQFYHLNDLYIILNEFWTYFDLGSDIVLSQSEQAETLEALADWISRHPQYNANGIPLNHFILWLEAICRHIVSVKSSIIVLPTSDPIDDEFGYSYDPRSVHIDELQDAEYLSHHPHDRSRTGSNISEAVAIGFDSPSGYEVRDLYNKSFDSSSHRKPSMQSEYQADRHKYKASHFRLFPSANADQEFSSESKGRSYSAPIPSMLRSTSRSSVAPSSTGDRFTQVAASAIGSIRSFFGWSSNTESKTPDVRSRRESDVDHVADSIDEVGIQNKVIEIMGRRGMRSSDQSFNSDLFNSDDMEFLESDYLGILDEFWDHDPIPDVKLNAAEREETREALHDWIVESTTRSSDYQFVPRLVVLSEFLDWLFAICRHIAERKAALDRNQESVTLRVSQEEESRLGDDHYRDGELEQGNAAAITILETTEDEVDLADPESSAPIAVASPISIDEQDNEVASDDTRSTGSMTGSYIRTRTPTVDNDAMPTTVDDQQLIMPESTVVFLGSEGEAVEAQLVVPVAGNTVHFLGSTDDAHSEPVVHINESMAIQTSADDDDDLQTVLTYSSIQGLVDINEPRDVEAEETSTNVDKSEDEVVIPYIADTSADLTDIPAESQDISTQLATIEMEQINLSGEVVPEQAQTSEVSLVVAEPTLEQSTIDAPTEYRIVEESVPLIVEESMSEAPIVEEPVAEAALLQEEPTFEEPMPEAPISEDPVHEVPLPEQIVSEELIEEEPEASPFEEPTPEMPVSEDSVAETLPQSIPEEPASEEPAIEEPITEEALAADAIETSTFLEAEQSTEHVFNADILPNEDPAVPTDPTTTLAISSVVPFTSSGEQGSAVDGALNELVTIPSSEGDDDDEHPPESIGSYRRVLNRRFSSRNEV
jgi:hypothetical protein